jgi:hypothetical protein
VVHTAGIRLTDELFEIPVTAEVSVVVDAGELQ